MTAPFPLGIESSHGEFPRAPTNAATGWAMACSHAARTYEICGRRASGEISCQIGQDTGDGMFEGGDLTHGSEEY